MALECQNHQFTLHQIGKKELKALDQEYGHPSNQVREAPEPEPVVPDPSIFHTLNTSKYATNSDTVRLPSIAECATHLELLETFYVLRQRILRSDQIDGTLGIEHVHITKTGRNGDQKTLKDETLWERRQVKWPRFIELAVIRFLTWRKLCEQDASSYRIPPIDVLMVWHAFLLNPRLFRASCGDKPLYKMHLPWARIHVAIDNSDWTFNIPKEGAEAFETATGLGADLFEQLSMWRTQYEGAATELVNAVASLTLESRPNIPEWIFNLPASDQVRRHSQALQIIDVKLAVQLRDAVLRQASFVDKMNAHMWIRSPGLSGTMTRAVDRYSKFLRLMKLYPQTMFVPTLDIDLAWHTHQCNPLMYFKGTQLWAGRFINHDDTIVKDTLDHGFGTTKKLFRVHFGKEYRICGCWDCEALLSALEHPVKDKEGNISMVNIANDVAVNVAYFRALEIARRKKQPLPVQQ